MLASVSPCGPYSRLTVRRVRATVEPHPLGQIMPESTPEAYDLIARAVFAHDASAATVARIVALGPAAVAPLQDALALGDGVGRRIGVLGLAAIPDRAIIAPLLNFASVATPEEYDLVPLALAGATSQLGPEDRLRLVAFAGELAMRPDPATRCATADLCAKVGIGDPTLLVLASDVDDDVAARARAAIGALGPSAADGDLGLKAALVSSVAATRQSALDALGQRDDASAILAALLGHASPLVSARACPLVAEQPEFLATLVELARDPRRPIALRRAALAALPLLHAADYPPHRPLIGEALAAGDPAMRAAAAAAVGRCAHPMAVRDAAGLLLDADLGVVTATADAWARLGGRERGVLVPPATDVLEQWAWQRFGDPSIVAPTSALLRGLLGAHIAGVPLEERVTHAVWRYTGSPHERVRALARRVHAALMTAPDPVDAAGVDPVLGALESGAPDALERAGDALAGATAERIELYLEPLLAASLVAPDSGLVALCSVLGRARAARATAFLRRLLAHASADVRLAAAAALPAGEAP